MCPVCAAREFEWRPEAAVDYIWNVEPRAAVSRASSGRPRQMIGGGTGSGSSGGTGSGCGSGVGVGIGGSGEGGSGMSVGMATLCPPRRNGKQRRGSPDAERVATPRGPPGSAWRPCPPPSWADLHAGQASRADATRLALARPGDNADGGSGLRSRLAADGVPGGAGRRWRPARAPGGREPPQDQREVRAHWRPTLPRDGGARAEDRRLPNGHRNLPAVSYPTIIG